MEFTLGFLDGELIFVDGFETFSEQTDSGIIFGNKTLIIVESVPDFEFTFPFNMESWQTVDEQTLGEKMTNLLNA